MNNLYNKISFTEMNQIIEKSNNYQIIDVRTSAEYKEGRIPNSILIPYYEIENITNIISDKNKILFIYCRSGYRSRIATYELLDMGYNKVYDVGGIIYYNGKIEY